jgi:hypothetical protein
VSWGEGSRKRRGVAERRRGDVVVIPPTGGSGSFGLVGIDGADNASIFFV